MAILYVQKTAYCDKIRFTKPQSKGEKVRKTVLGEGRSLKKKLQTLQNVNFQLKLYIVKTRIGEFFLKDAGFKTVKLLAQKKEPTRGRTVGSRANG